MTELSRLSTDARMVHRMAQSNGLDLVDLVRHGRVSADDISDVIQSCGRCANKTGCKSWLNAHHTPVETTPGFCRNKPWFDDVKEG